MQHKHLPWIVSGFSVLALSFKLSPRSESATDYCIKTTGFHVDDSEVTLNVCLGKEFDGGELFFRGVRCDKHVNGEARPEVLNVQCCKLLLLYSMLWWGSMGLNQSSCNGVSVGWSQPIVVESNMLMLKKPWKIYFKVSNYLSILEHPSFFGCFNHARKYWSTRMFLVMPYCMLAATDMVQRLSLLVNVPTSFSGVAGNCQIYFGCSPSFRVGVH